jgi:hypothetical protein
MDGCSASGARMRPADASSTHDMEVVMSVGSVSGSQSPIAILTHLAVAAQTAKQAQQASSPAVQAMELRNVKAIATGTVDTYA